MISECIVVSSKNSELIVHCEIDSDDFRFLVIRFLVIPQNRKCIHSELAIMIP